jgi:pimeloyl-ACP methyl ester carboxylesterase
MMARQLTSDLVLFTNFKPLEYQLMKCLSYMILVQSLTLLLGCGNDENLLNNPVTEVSEVTIFEIREFNTHKEIDLVYPTTLTTLAGTLYIPLGQGPFPVILFHFGSNAWERDNTHIDYPTNLYFEHQIALFVYDRRGLGRSGGTCCESSIFLLADDVIAGVAALSTVNEIDSTKIGVLGFSQGGWVVPLAAARSKQIAFTIVGSGGAVSEDEEALYSLITGDEKCEASNLSHNEIDNIMADVSSGGYDPQNDLILMDQPAYWYYGENDTSHPIRQAIANLQELKQAYGKDWEIKLHPSVNHEFIIDGGPCDSEGEVLNTFDSQLNWLEQVLDKLQ